MKDVRKYYGMHGIFDIITTDLINYWSINLGANLNISASVVFLKTILHLIFNNSYCFFSFTLYICSDLKCFHLFQNNFHHYLNFSKIFAYLFHTFMLYYNSL